MSKKQKENGAISAVDLLTCRSITNALIERAKYLSEKLRDYYDVLDLDNSCFFTKDDLYNSMEILVSEFRFDASPQYIEFTSIDKWDNSLVIITIATSILKKSDEEIKELVKAGYEAKYGEKEREEREEAEHIMARMSASEKRQFKKYLELKQKFEK